MNRIYKGICMAMLAVLLLVFVICIFDGDDDRSRLENRELKQKPELSFSAILDGSFFRDYERYFADQFPGREGLLDNYQSWIQILFWKKRNPLPGQSLIPPQNQQSKCPQNKMKNPRCG